MANGQYFQRGKYKELAYELWRTHFASIRLGKELVIEDYRFGRSASYCGVVETGEHGFTFEFHREVRDPRDIPFVLRAFATAARRPNNRVRFELEYTGYNRTPGRLRLKVLTPF